MFLLLNSLTAVKTSCYLPRRQITIKGIVMLQDNICVAGVEERQSDVRQDLSVVMFLFLRSAIPFKASPWSAVSSSNGSSFCSCRCRSKSQSR